MVLMGDSARVRRSEGLPFVQVATAIIRDRALSAQARHLYTVLASYADISSRETRLYRSTLAEDIGKSRDTLDRLTRELVNAGVVTVLRSTDEAGDFSANTYILHDAELIRRRSAPVPDAETDRQVAASVRPPVTSSDEEPAGEGGRSDAATSPHGCGDGGRSDAGTVAAPMRLIKRDKERETKEREESPAEPAADAPLSKSKQPKKPRTPRPDRNANRPDVDRLCQRMVELVVANGSKKPTPAAVNGWRDDARLLLDADGRELDKAIALMEWASDHDFWRSNIRSIPKFREQYDTVRLQAVADWNRRKRPDQAPRPAGQSLWDRQVNRGA